MGLCWSVMLQRLGDILGLFLAAANNSRGRGVKLAQVRERIHVLAVQLDRPLELVSHFFGEPECLDGMYAVGLLPIGPAQPQMIATIRRLEPNRNFALVD